MVILDMDMVYMVASAVMLMPIPTIMEVTVMVSTGFMATTVSTLQLVWVDPPSLKFTPVVAAPSWLVPVWAASAVMLMLIPITVTVMVVTMDMDMVLVTMDMVSIMGMVLLVTLVTLVLIITVPCKVWVVAKNFFSIVDYVFSILDVPLSTIRK